METDVLVAIIAALATGVSGFLVFNSQRQATLVTSKVAEEGRGAQQFADETGRNAGWQMHKREVFARFLGDLSDAGAPRCTRDDRNATQLLAGRDGGEPPAQGGTARDLVCCAACSRGS